jgi:hypothetical protein
MEIVRQRTDTHVLRAYTRCHTTSRVAVAGISFPTDLENNMSARPVYLNFCRHLYPWLTTQSHFLLNEYGYDP